MRARGLTAAGATLMTISLLTGSVAVAVVVEHGGERPAAGHRSAVVVPPSPTATAPSPARDGRRVPAVTVQVNGAVVPASGPATVGAALSAAGVRPRDGRYLAAVSHRLLGPDGQRARVTVDGRAVRLSTPISTGQRIEVVPGRDLPEPTETVVVRHPADAPSALYVGSRPGVVRVTRGTLSHEVVRRHVVHRPHVGRLVRPGAVALTFDDGPDPPWTRRVLALLARHHVHATFCMIGRQAAEHPVLVRRVARAGHALCDHTWDHDLGLRSRPRQQISLDIRRGERAIRRATGGDGPAFFRAPGGNWSAAIDRVVDADGMTSLSWTVDTRDWARPGVPAILHAVRDELRPGGVILMHDGGGDRHQTLAALRVLLRRLPHMGYHFVLPPAR